MTASTTNGIGICNSGNINNIKKFIVLIFSKQDTSCVKTDQKALVDAGGPIIILEYFETLESLISILSSTPDLNQATQIAQKVTNFYSLIKKVIASLPGLKNFETDMILMMDTRNIDFYMLLDQFKVAHTSLISNPATALDYFSNGVVQEKLAKIFDIACEVSSRYTNPGKFLFFGLLIN